MPKKKTNDKLRKQAEKRIDPAAIDIENMGREDLEKLAHELTVHQAELEIQNENLQKTQAELQQARDKYRDLFEFAPVGYFTLSRHNIILEANLTGSTMLNLPRQKMKSRRFTEFISPWETDRFYLHRKAVQGSEESQTCELWMAREDSTAFYARLRSQCIDGGRLRIALMDISDLRQYHEALEASRETVSRELAEIEAIYQATGVGLCTLDRQLRFTRVNKAFAAINGISAEDHIGKTIREVVPDLAAKAEELAERIFLTEEPVYDVEISGLTPSEPNRQRYWVEHWVPIKDPAGNILGINVSAEEITELLDLKETITASQTRYKELADSITDIFFALDSELRYTFWNKACEEFTGVAAADALGRHLLDIFPDNEQTRRGMRSYRQVMETGEAKSFYNEFHWNGATHHFQITAYPTGTGVSVFSRNVTGEMQLQELLITRTALLEAIMEHTPAQLVYLDRDFNFVAVNTAYAESAGFSKEELIGKNHFDIFPHEENQAVFTRARDIGETMSYADKPFLFPEQPERGVTYWDWSIAPVRNTQGAVIGLVFSLTETTERVIAQEMCQRYERLATLGELAGTISHELRNPLATIDNSVFVLKRRLQDADEKVHDNLKRIKSSVDRSVATIQSLLNLTRMKEPARVSLDLGTVVRESLEQEELPADIKVQMQLSPEPAVVQADRELLLLCFGNIIRNAVEAMNKKGEITISLEQSDGRVELAFTDTGPGIPPENIAQVVKPLFSTKASGAGFGLAIANQVAEKHGGGLKFDSTVGEGTSVSIILPLSSEKEEGNSNSTDRR